MHVECDMHGYNNRRSSRWCGIHTHREIAVVVDDVLVARISKKNKEKLELEGENSLGKTKES